MDRQVELDRRSWPAAGGAAALLQQLRTRGLAWYRFPEALDLVDHPRELAHEMLGPGTVGRVDTELVEAVKDRAEVVRNDGAVPVHSDECPILPANVQIMVCHRQADSGGESTYLDTRPVLERLAADDPELLDRLFTEPDPLLPVFSWRSGSLVCTLGAVRPASEGPRARFASVVDAVPPVVLRAQPGDVVVIDNHRWLHGRRAFTGARRFTRLLCWTGRPLGVPVALEARARAAAADLARGRDVEQVSDWTTAALVPHAGGDAARRLAAAVACLAGEPERGVCEQWDVELDDLRWWVERVMGAGLRALEQESGLSSSFAELWTASMQARVDGAVRTA